MSGGFFGELYLRSTRPLLSSSTTLAEVGYLEQIFVPGARLLDVGCGHGRHAWLLSSRGRPTIGVELDELSLAEREAGLVAARADMRWLPFGAQRFDGGFAWYSSLFIFGDDEHPALLREIARCLKPGATFVMQTVPYEYLASHVRDDFTLVLPDGGKIAESSRFDRGTGRDRGVRRLTFKDGRVLSAEHVIRYYPRSELEALFEAAGFSVKWIHGDLAGAPLAPSSAELIIGVERRDG